MLVVGNRLGEFVEKDLHRHSRHLRQHQSEGIVGAGLAAAEDVCEREAVVGKSRRTNAFCKPAVADAPLLADARFVLEKYPYAFAFMCIRNRLEYFWGSF
jgi:hypothetical protein